MSPTIFGAYQSHRRSNGPSNKTNLGIFQRAKKRKEFGCQEARFVTNIYDSLILINKDILCTANEKGTGNSENFVLAYLVEDTTCCVVVIQVKWSILGYDDDDLLLLEQNYEEPRVMLNPLGNC